MVTISFAVTFRSPVKVIFTEASVRAWVVTSATATRMVPAAAPAPPAAAATAPVIVSLESAFIVREAASIEAFGNTRAVVVL